MTEARAIGFQDCKIAIAKAVIAELCDRWKIDALYLFDSVLRDDFHLDSDVDVMVSFSPDAHRGWTIVSIKKELEELLARKVDFLTRKSIEDSQNWIRRREILSTARLFYGAR